MITTLLLLTLLAGAPHEPSPRPDPPSGPEAATSTAFGGQEKGFQICTPPAVGTWWVFQDCLLLGAHSVSGHVVVFENVTLTLAAGASLDVDFNNRFLRIRDQARVIIRSGARIH